VHYGFTNWTGDLARDDDALIRYVLAAKRARGPVMEENWSLRWVTEQCAAACVPIYRTLLGLACGATGISVYTACATAGWGEHLRIDRDYLRATTGDPGRLDPPYGDAAPIRADGSAGPSLDALRTLTRFLRAAGPALAATRPEPGPVLLVQPTHAAVTAWRPDPALASADRTIAPFVRHCLLSAVPFTLAFAPADAGDGPIVTTSGPFMSAANQEFLAAEAGAGRPVLLLGALPDTDEHGKPCTRLADITLAGAPITVVADLDELPGELDVWPPTAPRGDRRHDAVVELRRVGTGGDVFVFLFHRAGDDAVPVTTAIPGGLLRTTLGPGGCAAIHCRDGHLIGAYVKGRNELTGASIKPEVTVGADRSAGSERGDLARYPGLT
jgi:beta-galactosidase